jgi:hypothetical protein
VNAQPSIPVAAVYAFRVIKDPLAPLLDLPGVAPALDQARAAVDGALAHRALRRQGGRLAAELSLRSAVASASLEGYGYPRESVRAGLVTQPVVQGALRVAEALPGLVDVWPKAPGQVLARLHELAARGVVPEDELGRPATAAAAERLATLVSLVAGGTAGRLKVPPLLLAAVVHGELLALRAAPAFAGPGGVVARAAARLTLISGGFDPRGLIAMEVGHQAREPEYVGAANAFATGTPDGIRAWVRHMATATELGAVELATVADELR